MLTATDLIELAAVSFLASLLGSYIRRKGENLATKEDVAEITRKQEEVRNEFQKLREQSTQRQQLRLAAIDRRLEKHQEAYSLWWELRAASRDRMAIGRVVAKCQTWWVNNGLYLDKDAREAFYRAYLAASFHPSLIGPGGPRDESAIRAIRAGAETIDRAAEAIEKGVELPSIRISDEELGKELAAPPSEPNRS
jgi:hypothetical protein